MTTLSERARPRLILDCDPGLDDAVAIALAFDHAEVVGITTVGGNVGLENTTANALALCDVLAAAGHDTNVPVHAGHDLPMNGSLDHRALEYHGPFGTGSVRFPQSSRTVDSNDAVAWMIETIRAEEGLWLVPTGPLTNVANAIQAAPDIVDRLAGICWMGGSSTAGNTTPAAEFNAWVDPEAAAIVFGAGQANLVMLGLNITHEVLLDSTWIGGLRERTEGSPLSVYAELLTYYEQRQREMTTLKGAAVHDALAVLYVTHPELFAGARYPVQIAVQDAVTRGMTLVDKRPTRALAPATARVIEWADITAIQDVILESLSARS